ncbi:MAG: hypothetical protein BA872_03000 [Desulfobacterales bacterium C00003060]|nr:MAG: hypothetical protein BA861_08125 [Desulfobacterales bacterium S3730MH5]OEU79547.1 MAG: hypothetical protein BA872_03000 [Desulfobacterales bacterium C00003060]
MNLPRINLIICLGFLIFFPQCGKKAPPAAPEATVPPAVKDLKAETIGDKVLLTWSVLNKGNTLFDGLEHFGVYKSESHISAEICPGCPIPFEHYLDIKLDDPKPARVEGDRIVFPDNIKADHRYAYKVVVYHKSGGVSKDSNIVEFAVGSDQGASAQ